MDVEMEDVANKGTASESAQPEPIVLNDEDLHPDQNGSQGSGQKRRLSGNNEDDEGRNSKQSHIVSELDGQDVRVLQIYDPSDFFVRLKDHEKMAVKLDALISKICADPFRACPEELNKDDLVFVYCKKKKRWCRARVIEKIQDPSKKICHYGMFLFDLGIREKVDKSSDAIKKHDPELFDQNKWPPLALHCALGGIRPLDKERAFSREACLKMAQLSSREMKLFVPEARWEGDVLNVDLLFSTTGAAINLPSLSEALVYQGLARWAYGQGPVIFPVPKTQLRPTYPERELLNIGKTYSVIPAHVDTPDRFFVNLLKNNSVLVEITTKLEEYCTKLDPEVWTLYRPLDNAPCVAKYTDGKFYRALIVDRPNENQCHVLYVDFGNSELANNVDLRVIKQDLIKYARQAIPCRLADVKPAFAFKWNERAIQHFKDMISATQGHLTIRVLNLDEKRVPTVQLRLWDGQIDENLNAKFCLPDPQTKETVACSTGRYSQDDEDDIVEAESNGSSDLRKLNQSRSRVKSLVPLKISSLAVLKELYERNKEAGASLKQSLIKVHITFAEDPDVIFFRLDLPEVNEYFSSMEEELNNEYKLKHQHSNVFIRFKFKDKVAFCRKENGELKWERGMILTEPSSQPILGDGGSETAAAPDQGEKVETVFAVDYGIPYTKTKLDNIRPLSGNFQKSGPFAIKSKLHHVKPSGGSSEWSQTAKDCLADFFQKYAKNTYVLVKKFGDKTLVEADFIGLSTTIRGPVDPEEHEYHSLTKLLYDQGVIHAMKSLDTGRFEFQLDEEELNKKLEEYDPLLRQSTPMSLNSSSHLTSLSNLSNKKEIVSLVSRTPFYKYYAPEYPTNKTFLGIVSDIDDAFCITFRLCPEPGQVDKLVQINNAITEQFRNEGVFPSYRGPLASFAACSAYYTVDKTWNRAEICNIVKKGERNYITVRFVDYGQMSEIIIDNLSSKVFHPEIPKLALSAKLYGCRPKKGTNSQGMSYSELLKDELYKLLVDQKCKFEWVNHPHKPMQVKVFVTTSQRTEQNITGPLQSQDLISQTSNDSSDNAHPKQVERSLELFRKSQYVPLRVPFQHEKFYPMVLVQNICNNYVYLQPNEYKPMEQRSLEPDEDAINKQFHTFSNLQPSIQTSIQYLRGYHERDERQLKPPHHLLAKFDDGDYYRAIIIGADEEASIWEVLFVDYGNTTQVTMQDIRKISSSFMCCPVNAFVAKISNIRPAGNRPWTSELSNIVGRYLEDLAQDHKIQLIGSFTKSFVEDNLRHIDLFQDIDYVPYEIDLYIARAIGMYLPQQHALQRLVDEGLLEFKDPSLLHPLCAQRMDC